MELLLHNVCFVLRSGKIATTDHILLLYLSYNLTKYNELFNVFRVSALNMQRQFFFRGGGEFFINEVVILVFKTFYQRASK